MSSYSAFLIFTVMMAVSSLKLHLNGITLAQVDLSVTSCSQYNAVQASWNKFDGRVCYVQLFKFQDQPATITCGYVQIGYPNQTGILSTGVSFLTVYDQATNTSTVYNYTWTGSELEKGKVVQTPVSTINQASLTVLVAQNTTGYCVISCPIFDLSGLKVKACSLPNTMYCCTYDQFAPDSDAKNLISAAQENGVNTYGAIATDQSSCPTTVNQYTKPTLVPLIN